MASRFWSAQGGSDSEEESSEYESENEERLVADSSGPAGAVSKYLQGDSDSDDDDQPKRTVKSLKDKRFEEILATVEQMKNAMEINDWVSLQESFDKINKQLEKVMRITETDKAPIHYSITKLGKSKQFSYHSHVKRPTGKLIVL